MTNHGKNEIVHRFDSTDATAIVVRFENRLWTSWATSDCDDWLVDDTGRSYDANDTDGLADRVVRFINENV